MIFKPFPGCWLSFISGPEGGVSVASRATPRGKESALHLLPEQP